MNKVEETKKATNKGGKVATGETLASVKEVKESNFHVDVKAELKAVNAKFNEAKGQLKVEDKKGLATLNRDEKKAVTKTLTDGFHGLFNLVDYFRKVGTLPKHYSAFSVLSKVKIDSIIKAGFNGRRYTVKAIEKAVNELVKDKENQFLNEAKGQRLSELINTVHNTSTTDSRATTKFVRSLLDEKFINVDKCTEFVAFTMGIFDLPLNERCKDLFEAVKIKQAESERTKEVKTTLFELYKSGEIVLSEETAEV